LDESTEQEKTRPAVTAKEETSQGYGYRMMSKKGSNAVLSIYKEWFGVGVYEMIPANTRGGRRIGADVQGKMEEVL
jgi:hypothetical protein